MQLVNRIIKFWLLLALFSALCYVAWLNLDRVTITLPFVETLSIPLAVALVISFFIGATTITLYFIFDLLKKSVENTKLRRKVKKLQQELSQLEFKIHDPQKSSNLSANEKAPLTGSHLEHLEV